MIDHRNTIVVIPSRMAATRLPGKPLADIGGLPMIVHVWKRAVEVESRARFWSQPPRPRSPMPSANTAGMPSYRSQSSLGHRPDCPGPGAARSSGSIPFCRQCSRRSADDRTARHPALPRRPRQRTGRYFDHRGGDHRSGRSLQSQYRQGYRALGRGSRGGLCARFRQDAKP